MTEQDRLNLLRRASDSALELDRQLNLLLDAYDFYIARYPADTPSAELELRDLQVSIKALGTLPRLLAIELSSWKTGDDPTLSPRGFEINVMNELALHMHSIAYFLNAKGIDLDPFNAKYVGDALLTIRKTNRVLSLPASTTE